jgi:uncharacterized integral membrane protein
MRGFGQTLLVLCIISGAISVFAIFGGNQYETANGVVFFGSALGGMLMSCVLITLVDIRDAVRITAVNSETPSPTGTSL